MKKLKWRRWILPFDWNSDYKATDGSSSFKILRNRKTRQVQLFIWRGQHKSFTEMYSFLPSVRMAKAVAESRRETIKTGKEKSKPNPLVW